MVDEPGLRQDRVLPRRGGRGIAAAEQHRGRRRRPSRSPARPTSGAWPRRSSVARRSCSRGCTTPAGAGAVLPRHLEAALGHPAQANAYLTPRRSQGLPVHHDTHDVFVLQVAGHKRWLVYAPVFELPLKHQRYDAEMGAPGETVLDIVVEPGDTLYLPRGWLHEALTSDEDSLHLTVGVNVVTWLDAFRAALERLEDDVDFRRSLPADGVGADGLVERLAARLEPDEVLAADRARPLGGAAAGARRAALRPACARPPRPGHAARATSDGVVRPLGGPGRGGHARVRGPRPAFPAARRPEVRSIASSTGPFAAADLPGRLDEPGRLVLLRRLVREGFLRLARRPR